MNSIFSCLKGIALGAGAILPGISSGVLCVVFGIYEQLIRSVLDFFKDIKGNLKFLFPILLGVGIGVILFGNLIRFLFATYPIPTQYAFIGLIIGSLPVLFRTANQNKGFRLHYFLYTLGTFLLAVFLLVLEHSLSASVSCNTSFLFLLFCGLVMSIGVVVPGVSSTVLLMLLGVYDVYLQAVSSVELSVLFPMGIGVGIGGILCMKLTKFFLDHYPTQTYYSIIGFVLGSVLILYPGFSFDVSSFLGIAIFLICFLVAYQFEKSS